MSVGAIDLVELARRLATRSARRSEATVQSDVRLVLLAAPLNLADTGVVAINLETPAGLRRRIDVEAGFTIIEVKRDLRVGSVRAEAVEQLAGYVTQRTSELGQRYVGVLTDGAEWAVYHLTPAGDLAQAGETFMLDSAAPDVEALCTWLESVLATQQQLTATPREIESRLGAGSPSHSLDFADILALYERYGDLPSVQLKRQLWAKLLTTALGSSFEDDDELFVEHTLLVAIAEVIAHAVIGLDPTQLAPTTILAGSLFEQAQISGVVEQDFFDWLVDDGVEGGEALVRTLARRLARFDWSDVQHDVMKVLYESVIGRAQRYDLGEYYTPDWLAERIVDSLVVDPLNERVLDPGCGSGTFLFWAVRHYLAAADAAGHSRRDSLTGATDHVIGVDVHPLAVSFARVTYLLALGKDRIAAPGRPPIAVPVYLGDSVQWGQDQTLLTAGTLTVSTDGGKLFGNDLRFPDALIADAGRFDRLVAELAEKASHRDRYSPFPSLTETFRRFPMAADDAGMVGETFAQMCQLHDDEQDHIWGYYIRNLARPTWLAQPQNRVDVVLGNPPWLTYNAIAPDLKPLFRAACEERNLWGGAPTARNYDLCALFAVRAIELYLKLDGRFGFVMPYAALSRKQFTGFRAADYPAASEHVTVAFGTPWDLDGVRPHPFPVPSSVVFGTRTSGGTSSDATPMPAETDAWTGRLPARNLDWHAAAPYLSRAGGVVLVPSGAHASPYAQRFESGAKLNPQVLVIVEPSPAGPLGVPAGFRRVRSLRSTHAPWSTVTPLEGVVEEQFVKGLHLGSTVLPFRDAQPLEAIVPWDSTSKRLLEDDDERLDRYPQLADWWSRAGALWSEHGTPDVYNLTHRIDYQRKLSRQLPIQPQRVVYTKSGTRLTAARLEDARSVVGDKLYWATASSPAEARYLTTVLNSAVVSDGVAPYQSRGQFGARDFDLYVWYLPIPAYSDARSEHRDLAELGKRAEEVAAAVALPEGIGFKAARTRVRAALSDQGVAQQMEAAVASLLA